MTIATPGAAQKCNEISLRKKMGLTRKPERLISAITRIHACLAALPDDTLTERSANLYRELLEILSFAQSETTVTAVLSDPGIFAIRDDLQQRFSRAAFEYERQWSLALAERSDPAAALRTEYPFFEHYRRATELEYEAVRCLSGGRHPQRILVVGSGPLPSTVFRLAIHTAAPIHGLDIAPRATAAASRLASRLTLTDQVSFMTGDILEQTDLGDYDAVWLAALAGDQIIKSRLLEHLHRYMRPGAILLARTAASLRTLLYPRIAPDDLAAFHLRFLLQPFTRNYHASLIAERPDPSNPESGAGLSSLPLPIGFTEFEDV